ncbi:MAG TPA: hypothetical protein VNA20_02305 [Frankiaceae bacterium]|nr:hypothetical protein [Frankiaceae bacterium]
MLARRQRLIVLALTSLLATASVGVAGGTGKPDSPGKSADAPGQNKLKKPKKDRGEVAADRYEPAGGCYVLRSAETGKYVGRAGDAFRADAARETAAPFTFQAFDLGKYLLYGSARDFLAVEGGPADGVPVTQAARYAIGYADGTGDENLEPVRDPVTGAIRTGAGAADALTAPARAALSSKRIVAAKAPSAKAEWVLADAGKGEFALRLPVDDGEPENPGAVDPAIAGTLTAAKDASLSVEPGARDDKAHRFTLELAQGCAAYPEIETNVTGAPYAADTAFEETRGYFDGHLHMMAFEFIGGRSRCGRPWHPYGVPYALVDCPDHEPGGRGAVLEAALSGTDPVAGHDTTGWPEFTYWPKYDSLTHEQVYYKWLERAWLGGVRMFTNLLVDNNVLCELYPYKKNSCNEMDGVFLQAQRLQELERYVDAQHGGPGEGWFRIVRDPFEARRVVNEGKLAVVMGIEVSVPFDCGEHLEVPHCTEADIKGWVDKVHDLGVVQMELTNKFDNALTGVTGDSALQGPVVNAGNKYETGHNWKLTTCEDGHEHDKLQMNVADGHAGHHPPDEIGRDAIFAGILETFGETGAAPVYAHGPHCNLIGLSGLGRYALDQLMAKGMVFDPDHMSAKARAEAMAYVGDYPGLISSHSWADDSTYRRILENGGVVTPHAGRTTSFVDKWRKLRGYASAYDWSYGLGFGSDVNGFSTQGAPRNPPAGQEVQYPFPALGGVQVDKQRSGVKVWDFNKTGLDHYGLYPDWVEDARIVAGADGDALVAELTRGAEAYLQMWERAAGVRAQTCLTNAELAELDEGMSPRDVLYAVGQPVARQDATFTYCGPAGTVTVTFDEDGELTSVG